MLWFIGGEEQDVRDEMEQRREEEEQDVREEMEQNMEEGWGARCEEGYGAGSYIIGTIWQEM